MTRYIPPHTSALVPDEYFTLTLSLDDLLHMSPISSLLRRTGYGQLKDAHTLEIGEYTYTINPIITPGERMELIKRYTLTGHYVPMNISFTLVSRPQAQLTG